MAERFYQKMIVKYQRKAELFPNNPRYPHKVTYYQEKLAAVQAIEVIETGE